MAAYAAEGAVWPRLARLLPDPGDVDDVRACWDIGEQEAGLDVLVARLRAQGLAIGDAERAELAAMAGQWGEGDRLGETIVALPRDPARPAPPRVLADGAEEPLPVRSVLPDHPQEELFLLPWIACRSRDRVLARAHWWEEWGAWSHLTRAYVLFAAGRPVPPRLFPVEEEGAVWSALVALRADADRG